MHGFAWRLSGGGAEEDEEINGERRNVSSHLDSEVKRRLNTTAGCSSGVLDFISTRFTS